MSARFTPDVSSFEKLLAAAWILQCQRDEMASTAQVPAVDLELNTQRPSLDPQIALEQPSPQKALVAEEQPVACAVADPDPALAAVPSIEEQEADGPPVLAESANWEGASEFAAIAPSTTREAHSQNHALLRAIGRLASISSSGGAPKKDGVAITFRLVIPDRSMTILRASLVPVVVLLIIGGFLLSLPFSQKAAQASQSSGAMGASSPSLKSNKVSYTGTSAGTGPTASGMETSHLRITDSAITAVVNDLSPYEIQGLQRQAEYGDQFAALALGMAYETGHYVHPSCTKAAEWIAFAATNGNAAAQYNLALRYFQGDGVPQDPKEGTKWLRVAAAHGYPKPALAAEAR
jgi:hypothetical protein